MARELKYIKYNLDDDIQIHAVDMQVQNLASRFPGKSKAQVIEALKDANGHAGLAAKFLSGLEQMTTPTTTAATSLATTPTTSPTTTPTTCSKTPDGNLMYADNLIGA